MTTNDKKPLRWNAFLSSVFVGKREFWESAIINHILQFVFIFSSVYFAFWLTERNEHRKLVELEKQCIEGVHKELSNNLTGLRKSIDYHEKIVGKIRIYEDSLKRLYPESRFSKQPVVHLMNIFSRSENSIGATQLKNTAWTFLEGSDAYALLNYEVANALSSTYQTQSDGVCETVRMMIKEVFGSKDLYRPEETMVVMGITKMSIIELYGQEKFLATRIAEVIELLETRYPFLIRED